MCCPTVLCVQYKDEAQNVASSKCFRSLKAGLTIERLLC